jgi:pyruvate ferredoxin oxidoreductase alpha subunit
METMQSSTAITETVANCRPDIVACYPITPSTHIAEDLNKYYVNGKIKKYIAVESEFAAISVLVGASAAGGRTFSATSSQGLALMHEVLFASAGMRLPIVIVVANRSLSAPLSIWNDHQDSISQRDSGWMQLYCETNQEAVDSLPVMYRLAEHLMIPGMVCIDGYFLTHIVEQIDLPTKEQINKFLPEFSSRYKLDPKNPISLGVYAAPETYQEFREDLDTDIRKAEEKYIKLDREFGKITGRSHSIVEAYKTEDAERVLVAMGSVCGNIKEVVDRLRERREKVGMLKIRLFRPFPSDKVASILSGRKVGVFEKAVSLGAPYPLYADVRASVSGAKLVSSFAGGFAGRDVTPENIEYMFNSLKKGKPVREWIGRSI